MTPQEAQAYCTQLTKSSGSNFYYSFLFLPATRRNAMYTVYAFCKAVDSAVDEPTHGSEPKEELRRWRSELDAVYHGTPTWPIMISLAHHVRRLSIPQAYFEELIKGVEMDLTTTRYETFDALSLYCYRVASVVGLMCLHVFGATSAHAQDYAVDLGMAFQLTNILRDLATDAEQGRVYLPLEDLARFHCGESELLAKQHSPALRELVAFESARARQYYKKAQAALESLPRAERRALTVAEIMRAVYSRILERIEQPDHQIFGPRIRLSTSNRLALAAGVWVQSRFS
ncbi:Phytoene synthase [Nitrospira sp. KM1]|uniref:presqualene diphosphate synthase HpnD n=1 Tax=Nitrospira sp. KM1 TaxID=1936990 RepID=UPI0013A76D33|nr:presqualene diphosphate synthase HpnD [Nitrospira sp. KM1]BCA57005.1 Phytoene synthase [Nitrospira sp. KM1]